MNWSRTILDGIVMCVVFNSLIGLFFYVFPQAYSRMFPKSIKQAAAMLLKFTGNHAVANGLTAAWISIGNIWMFGGLLLTMKKGQRKYKRNIHQNIDKR